MLTRPIKSATKRELGEFVEVRRRRHLLQQAAVHDGAARGHGQGFVLVVGNHDEGDADLFLQGRQFGAHLVTQLGVERRQRFIEQQNARLLDQGARQSDALALAARQLVGLARTVTAQLHQFERFLGAAAAFFARNAVLLRP